MLSVESEIIPIKGMQGDLRGYLAKKGSGSTVSSRLEFKNGSLASSDLDGPPR